MSRHKNIDLSQYGKVVLNRGYGGFGISDKAIEHMYEGYGVEDPLVKARWRETFNYLRHSDKDLMVVRASPLLVKAVEELGEESWGRHAKLEIIDVPGDVINRCYIDEHDGYEVVREKHRIFPEYKQVTEDSAKEIKSQTMGATPGWVDFTP
jgi:hypothetical protein